MDDVKKIYIKDLYKTEWNNSDETLKNTFLETIKKDTILFNIFWGRIFDPLSIEITQFEYWKTKMPIDKEPDLREIPVLLSSYSSLMSSVSNIYIQLNLFAKKFEQAEEYYTATLHQEYETQIKAQLENYSEQLKNEKLIFESSIELDKKYEKLKQDFIKSNLENLDNKWNNLIDIEKKKMSSVQMDSYIKRNIIINEFKRKRDILDFAKLYLSDCNSIFNENINSLKKILTIHELLYKTAGIQ